MMYKLMLTFILCINKSIQRVQTTAKVDVEH